MPAPGFALEEALAVLRAHASEADASAVWPADSWHALQICGAVRWCIPASLEGADLDPVDLLDGYEKLAGACLTTAFILSQRDAACRRIRDSQNKALRSQLLRLLARGEAFATVGLSQLTTSRQHVRPTFVARRAGDRFVLEGAIPWVTGAERADYLVIGAVLDEGGQILAVLPSGRDGVSIDPPLQLMALEGSLTAEVRCKEVSLEPEWLLAGPAERVMAGGRGGTGGLETSCLAIGLAGAAIDYLHSEAEARPELLATTQRLEQTREALRDQMHRLAREGCTAEAAAHLRARANTLVLRATQAALTASKGTGFLRNHPAQRWARQALFFLVWSCPRPAAEATLAYLAAPDGPDCL